MDRVSTVHLNPSCISFNTNTPCCCEKVLAQWCAAHITNSPTCGADTELIQCDSSRPARADTKLIQIDSSLFWAATCCSWIDTAGKPCTCGGFLGGHMHWAASFFHKALCKIPWSCSRRTHKRHPPWPHDVPFSHSFVHTWHTSATGTQGKPCVCFPLFSYGQTHSVANLCVMGRQSTIRMLERLFIPDFTLSGPNSERSNFRLLGELMCCLIKVRGVGVFVYES